MRRILKKCLDNEEFLYREVKELNPLFNHYDYFSMNPDLELLGVYSKKSLYFHYLSQGHAEKRPVVNTFKTQLTELPKDFDPNVYAFINPDLQKVRDPASHFMNHGVNEHRPYTIGMDYKKLNKFLVEQDVLVDDDSIILINHSTSKTGAPIYLQDLANWLASEGEKVVWLDIFPSKCFKLHKSIKKLYYFNCLNVLQDILEANEPKAIYANSVCLMVKKWKLFKKHLPITTIHLHETWPDASNMFHDDKTEAHEMISECKEIYFVAEKILNNFDVPAHLQHKCRIVPPMIHPDRAAKILKTRKRKRKNKRVKIGMCGTVCSRKNPMLFKELALQNPEYDFVWIGGVMENELDNLQCIPATNNPYPHFEKLDYFMLTSTRDPCPIVVLESLLMNHKLILLENNIRYEHPVSELENVLVIRDHKLSTKIITDKFKNLKLDTEFNKTNKNQDYALKVFTTRPKIGKLS